MYRKWGPRSTALLFSLFLVGGAAVVAQEFATARARLHPANESGVKGSITFTYTAAGRVISGTATGLETSVGRYVSLVYDVGSVPGGPELCEPVDPFPNMFIGFWEVDADGKGTLIQANPNPEDFGRFDTISIRDTETNEGFGPEAVVACGQVAVHPAAP